MATFSLQEQKGGVTQSTWLVEADTTGLCGQGLLTGALGLVHSWLFLWLKQVLPHYMDVFLSPRKWEQSFYQLIDQRSIFCYLECFDIHLHSILLATGGRFCRNPWVSNVFTITECLDDCTSCNCSHLLHLPVCVLVSLNALQAPSRQRSFAWLGTSLLHCQYFGNWMSKVKCFRVSLSCSKPGFLPANLSCAKV